MKDVNKINNIPSDLFHNNNGIYFNKDNSIFRIEKDLEHFLSLDSPFIIEKIHTDFLFIRTKDFLTKISLIDKSKRWDFKFNVVGSKEVIFTNDECFLIRENFKDDDWIIFKGNFQNEIIWTIPSKESYLVLIAADNKFITLKEEIAIYSLSILNGENNWKYLFSELLQGEEIKQYGNIVTYENKVFMYLADNKDSKKTATISIDISSGEVVNVYKGFAGNLILSDNKIYVASYEMIKVLDLYTNEIIELDFKDILEPLKLSIHWNKSVVKGDYLYFVDGHFYTTNKLGILDLKLKKLVWNGEIKIKDDINNNIQKIMIADSRLYAHCSDNSLHVFEID